MPRSETYGALGRLFKTIGQTTSEISLLNKLAKERAAAAKRQAFLDSLMGERMELGEKRFGLRQEQFGLGQEKFKFEKTQAANKLKQDMLERITPPKPKPEDPSKPTGKVKTLRDLIEIMGYSQERAEQLTFGKKQISELDKDKEAYEEFILKWEPDDYGFDTVPSFGEFMTFKKGVGVPGAGVKEFKIGLPPAGDKAGKLTTEEEADYQRLLKKYGK